MKLPCKFESDTEGALSTDVPGLVLPPQVLKGWKFYVNAEMKGWTTISAVSGAEYLIKVKYLS